MVQNKIPGTGSSAYYAPGTTQDAKNSAPNRTQTLHLK